MLEHAKEPGPCAHCGAETPWVVGCDVMRHRCCNDCDGLARRRREARDAERTRNGAAELARLFATRDAEGHETCDRK